MYINGKENPRINEKGDGRSLVSVTFMSTLKSFWSSNSYLEIRYF